MEITGYSSKNNGTSTSRLTGCQIRFQYLHTCLHSSGCCQHLRYKNNLLLKIISNHRHSTDHAIVQDSCRITACINSFLYCFSYFLIFSVLCQFKDSLHFLIHRRSRRCLHCLFHCLGIKFLNIIQAILITLQQCICSINHTDHIFVSRIYNRTVHTGIHGQNHKSLVNIFSYRKTKGNI